MHRAHCLAYAASASCLIGLLAACSANDSTALGGAGNGAAAGQNSQGGNAGSSDAGSANGGASGSHAGNAGAAGTVADGHLVKGTLSGLTGDQVVLQDNGADDLTLNSDGDFAFATPVAASSPYAVTVKTQPVSPSQTCAVSNGSGTMPNADITGVTVSCTVNSFAVQAAVTGLTGSGLVLQDNGADDLPVSADGTYSFATQIQSGQAYAVTVLTQPSSPDQTCTVASGSGTVADSSPLIGVTCGPKDTDGDGVPDVSDPFPTDPSRPHRGLSATVYAHSDTNLYSMSVSSPYAITSCGAFNGSDWTGEMTDIALDQYGVLWGVTFDDVYVCNADNATCWKMATLPQQFNGLTLVPKGTLDPNQDALVGIANSGAWYRVTLSGSTAQLTSIGSYGGSYTSAGDAFSIVGVGTFAAVFNSGVTGTVIVQADPTNGHVTSTLTTLASYSEIYGLAGWAGSIFAFDATGAVLKVDPSSGVMSVIHTVSGMPAWWGAGVTTRM